MKSDDLHGIYPALPTPLTTEGRPDFQALEALVHRSLQAGVAGLVPMGGTGEFTALSNEDRVAVVRHVVEVSKGAVPVLPGVVSPGYKDSVELGQAYKAAGADALMLVTPFYVTPTQAGVKDYFRAYAKQAELPLVYYDIPARTGLITAIDTLAELAEDGTIIGVKVCHTDLSYFTRLATTVAGGLSRLSGDDMLYVSHRMHGAVGGVLASAPMLPRFYVELDAMITAGDFAGAIAKQLVDGASAHHSANQNVSPVRTSRNTYIRKYMYGRKLKQQGQ